MSGTNRRALGLLAGLASLIALAFGGGTAAPAAEKADADTGPKVRTVTLAIRHRIFHQFQDRQTVALQKEFPIGDTEWSARLVRYVPDFAMDLSTRKAVSRSAEPRNPAFQIIVRDKGKAVDTTWAMLSMPPHFTRRSYLAFKITRIDFEGRPPLEADSSAVAKELEALKEAARRSAPPEPEGPPPLANQHARPPKEGIAPVPSHDGTGESPRAKSPK